VIGDVDSAGSETVERIKRDGGEAIFVTTDVSNEAHIKNLIATAVKTYGGLHCAFNNAGVLPPMVPLAEMDESTFDSSVFALGSRRQRDDLKNRLNKSNA
jgi:NAD(P)-dependent dehydrogenase (short-subunit alcohol dehydrogenase family)